MSEEERMRQVRLNARANRPERLSPGGSITLDSELAESVMRLTVEDEGPELTEEQREVVERFVRFNPSAADDSGTDSGPRSAELS